MALMASAFQQTKNPQQKEESRPPHAGLA